MAAALSDLLKYVGFGPSDEAALRGLHRRAADRLPLVVDAFYAAIEADPVAHAVFADQAQIERLKLSLKDWLDRVLTGPWDDDYERLRKRIGHVHVKVGLPQHFMLTSMSVIRRELHVAVDESLEKSERMTGHQALARILDVDLAIMLETYREDSMAALSRLKAVEQKLLSDELNLSDERYRAVLESAEVIAIAIDRAGGVRLFNRQAELVSGRTRTSVLAESDLQEIWHPGDRLRMHDALVASRSASTSHVFEARMITRKQDIRFVRWHVTALPPLENGEVCFVGVDITAERDLGARTRRAEQLATLGTLAAGLAHEIRNPLNAAQLQLTVAERRVARSDKDLGKVALQPISVVRAELDRLATLVDDFLAYARPAPLRLRAIDLRVASRAVVQLMEPVASEAGVTISVIGTEAVTAHCDEEQCRQVLINLVSNAISAAKSGGGNVSVDVRRDGPSSFLRIADDGPGLPDELNVFEPFATSKEGGTGLGLSIVKRIVDQHNGAIHATREGDQTIFEIELPVSGPRT